jgi:hypothetical protein
MFNKQRDIPIGTGSRASKKMTEFQQVRSAARWFYIIIGLYVLGAALLGLHGSSLDVYAGYFPSANVPLIGTPKTIRSDEWDVQTPNILHQLFRDNPLSVDGGPAGPGHAGLLWNIPVKYVTTLFRPQLWSFFIFSPERAFSIYWQLKIALLIVGAFSLFHLITQRTGLSAALALFLFFSPYTQWAFSWASALPEMIGSACLAVSLLCRALVARNKLFMFAASIVAGLFAVNFSLCVYPPHQVAIAWVALAVLVWWIVSRWSEIWDPPLATWRLLAAGTGALVLVIGLGAFFIGARDEIIVAANTVYPGQRRVAGGGDSIFLYGSHFLDFWKTEQNTASLVNICEASGYLWFGPLTLLLAHRLKPGPSRTLYFVLIGLFAVLSIWIFLPIPAWVGQPFGLDFAPASRMIAGMGLLNALILAAFLASYENRAISYMPALTVSALALSCFLPVLFYINGLYALNLHIREIATSSLFAAAVLGFIAADLRVALGILLVAPLALSMGLVNPVDRGLAVVTHSELFAFLESHPDLRHRKWFFFADAPDIVGPDFFSAHGLDVFNSYKVLPDLAALKKLDPEDRYSTIYNSSGWIVARAQNPGAEVSFEHLRLEGGLNQVSLSPLDPKLFELGISVLAFKDKPAAERIAGLSPIGNAPVNGYWLYEIP